MISRLIRCPQCQREIRLTEPELADKRGFCAVCDARFDIQPDLVVGDGLRTASLTQVAPRPEEAPPTGQFAVEDRAGRPLVLWPR